MSENLQTPEQELAEIGVIASYIWKPNRLFIRNPDIASENAYIPADIVSDGSAEDVSAAVSAEGQAQIAGITALANEQKAAVSAHESDYTTVKSSLETTYQRMYTYFMSQGLIALATIMATAIVNLNLM